MALVKKKLLKGRMKVVSKYSVDKYYKINPKGLEVILGIMKKNNLKYGCELYDVTVPLVKELSSEGRERYQVQTTGQVITILNHIEENDLLGLNKKVGE